MAKAKSDTAIVIGPVLLSFPQLFKPKKVSEDSDVLKYGAKLVIRKDQKDLIKSIQRAMMAAAEAGKEKYKGKKIGGPGFKWALRDADKEVAEDGKEHGPETKNCFFLQASSDTAPGVVKRDGKTPIIDPNDIYAGCIVYASVNFFAYNTKGNWGVGVGLNNILKYSDGDRLSGKPSPQQDFKDLDILSEEEDGDFLNTGDSDEDFSFEDDDSKSGEYGFLD